MGKNTQFGAILFHRLSDSEVIEDEERDSLLYDLKVTLRKRGFEIDEQQFLWLPSDNFPIGECFCCGSLTIDKKVHPERIDSGGEFLDVVGDVVHAGTVIDGKFLCDQCSE